jgi:RNA polymerase sigma factor (sigma-70 family)
MSGILDNERFRKLLFSYPGKAIEFLYQFYYHRLLNISNRLTQNKKVSEDIVQEAFVLVWEKHKELGQHHEKSIEHYLVRVVKNMSITYYKKNYRLQESQIKYMNGNRFVSIEHSVEINVIEAEIYHELRNTIASFPKRERECLFMKIDDEMNNDQIAASLKVSVKAVERSLTSARKRLRMYWLAHNG